MASFCGDFPAAVSDLVQKISVQTAVAAALGSAGLLACSCFYGWREAEPNVIGGTNSEAWPRALSLAWLTNGLSLAHEWTKSLNLTNAVRVLGEKPCFARKSESTNPRDFVKKSVPLLNQSGFSFR